MSAKGSTPSDDARASQSDCRAARPLLMMAVLLLLEGMAMAHGSPSTTVPRRRPGVGASASASAAPPGPVAGAVKLGRRSPRRRPPRGFVMRGRSMKTCTGKSTLERVAMREGPDRARKASRTRIRRICLSASGAVAPPCRRRCGRGDGGRGEGRRWTASRGAAQPRAAIAPGPSGTTVSVPYNPLHRKTKTTRIATRAAVAKGASDSQV